MTSGVRTIALLGWDYYNPFDLPASWLAPSLLGRHLKGGLKAQAPKTPSLLALELPLLHGPLTPAHPAGDQQPLGPWTGGRRPSPVVPALGPGLAESLPSQCVRHQLEGTLCMGDSLLDGQELLLRWVDGRVLTHDMPVVVLDSGRLVGCGERCVCLVTGRAGEVPGTRGAVGALEPGWCERAVAGEPARGGQGPGEVEQGGPQP